MTDPGSSDVLGSLEDVRQGKARGAIPGLRSGARMVLIPSGDGYLRWQIAKPLALSGRGSQAGAIPAIGTPSEGSILHSFLRTGVYEPGLRADDISELPIPTDTELQESYKRLAENFRQAQRYLEELIGLISVLDPAWEVLETRELEAESVPASSSNLWPISFELERGGQWFAPQRMTTALSVGRLREGQKLDSAVPSVAGRTDELTWISPATTGQIQKVTWNSSDPSNQQRTGDQLFFAGLLLGVPIAAALALLERLIA